MRGFVWLVFASAACGSVGARSDAQPGDDGAVVEPPGTLRWVRSLSSLEALGIRTYVLRKIAEVGEMLRDAQVLAEDSRRPVAILLTKGVLGVK